MPKATTTYGKINPLDKCVIEIGSEKIIMESLPDISDTKRATYNDEPVIGRSFPIKTYSHSDNRSISMKVHFLTLKKGDLERNMRWLRALQSAVYPKDADQSSPFFPPPICRIKCGKLFTKDNDGFLCAVLESYSVDFPTDSVWDKETYLPYFFDVSLSWQVVFAPSNLPGHEEIINDFQQ